MGGKPWTSIEKQLLTTWAPRIGFEKTRQKLSEAGYKRTYYAVERKARDFSVRLGQPLGYWTISEITLSGRQYLTARKRAADEGVLERFRDASTKAPYVVPEWWALNYMEEQEKIREAESLGWYSTAEVAEVLGFDQDFVSNQFKRDTRTTEIKELLRSIERRRGTRNRWLHNPRDVERVQRQLHASKVVSRAA